MVATNQQLSVLCIDYFDTLASHRDAPPRLGDLLGMSEEFEQVWRAWGERRMTERVPFEELVEELFHVAGRRAPADLTAHVIEERRQRQARLLLEPDERILAMLTECRRIGLQIAVVSNAAVEDLEAWPDSPFAALVDATIFSWEVGATKPDPRIYEAALERLAVPASAAAFVSDTVVDLEGAQRVGFGAVLLATWFRARREGTADHPEVDRPEHLAGRLREIGIR